MNTSEKLRHIAQNAMAVLAMSAACTSDNEVVENIARREALAESVRELEGIAAEMEARDVQPPVRQEFNKHFYGGV